MKIGVSSTGKTLDSLLDTRLGRCSCFIIFDNANKQWEAVDNPGIQAAGGAGIKAAQALVDAGVEAVITGNVGPNAWDILQQAQVKLYRSNGGTIQTALEALEANGLECLQNAGPSHAGMGNRHGQR